jgi:hypothetical protein|nr:MAG TPA: tail protein [Caudoviricetes sp.]
MSLLPNHKSKFDKKFDELFGVRLDNLDLGAINILADSCPVSLLPILAQSYDVNIEGLGEEAIRELIKNAFEIHFYSGTFYAMKKAVSAYDKDALIVEGNLSQKYNGAFKFGGSRFYGSNNHWAEYSIITSGLTDRAKAQKLKEAAIAAAPARCVLVAVEARARALRYDSKANYDKTYNYGVY